MSNRVKRAGGRWLSKDKLRAYLLSGDSLEDLTRKHGSDYPVLVGEVVNEFGLYWFSCSNIDHKLYLPNDLPRFDWTNILRSGRSGLLTRRIKNEEDGRVDYEPMFLCPVEDKCVGPYIRKITSLFMLDTRYRVMAVENDEMTGHANIYCYRYDVAYTPWERKSVRELVGGIDSLDSSSSSFYAVVDDSSLVTTNGYDIGKMLFLTSSLNIALGAISTLVGNYTVQTQEGQDSTRLDELVETHGDDVEEGTRKKKSKRKPAMRKRQEKKDTISKENCVEEGASMIVKENKDMSKKRKNRRGARRGGRGQNANNHEKEASDREFEDKEINLDEPEKEEVTASVGGYESGRASVDKGTQELGVNKDNHPSTNSQKTQRVPVEPSTSYHGVDNCLYSNKGDACSFRRVGVGIAEVYGGTKMYTESCSSSEVNKSGDWWRECEDAGSDWKMDVDASGEKDDEDGDDVIVEADREQTSSSNKQKLSCVVGRDGELRRQSVVEKTNRKPVLHMSCKVPYVIPSCFLKTWDDTYGILRSDPGFILFKRKPDLVVLERNGQTVELLSLKCLCAVVVDLQQPETFLGYIVSRVGLLVWTGGELLEDWEELIKNSLDVYREDWDVEYNPKPFTSMMTPNPFYTKNGFLNHMKSSMNQQQPQIVHTEIMVKIPHTVINNVVCRRVLNETDFLVLTGKNNVTALALKKDFYKDKIIPQPGEWKKCDLKSITIGICALPLPLTKPFTFRKHHITHFAVVAYVGKKPSAADRVLARWREGKVERNTTLHIQSKECLEVLNLSFKLHDDSVSFTTTRELIDTQESKFCEAMGQKPTLPGDSECVETTVDGEEMNKEETEVTSESSDVQNVEVIVNMASQVKALVCQCVVVESDFLILMAKEKMILALKTNFFKNRVSTPPSCSLVDQLKNMPGPGVSVLAVKVTNPVCVEDIPITHFALVAYIGRKPSTADDIVAIWKANQVDNMKLTVHIDTIEDQKFVEFGFKVEYIEEEEDITEEPEERKPTLDMKNRDPFGQGQDEESSHAELVSSRPRKYVYQVKPQQQYSMKLSPPISTPYVTIKVIKHGLSKCLETNNARVYHAGRDTGLLEVRDENVAGHIYIFFSRESVYVNKEPLSDTRTVSQHLLPLMKRPLNCEARLFPARKGNVNKVVKIHGVQVHFIANVVWYGERLLEGESSSRRAATAAARSSFGEGAIVPRVSKPKPKARDTQVGHITEVHQLQGTVMLGDGQELTFLRAKCFLFGVCLKKVDLRQVLSVGDKVKCELRCGLGGMTLEGLWLEDQVSPNPTHIPATLDRWCRGRDLSAATRAIMLMEAGWLSPDLNPLADRREEKEVVDVC